MEKQDIDIFDAIVQGNIASIKDIDDCLFCIEKKLKNTLDAGVTADEFESIKSLYKSALASRDLLKELY